ncbi:MAG: DUF4351 domain-containing protein [Planctomycetes bacterium]|nr:DUF4351 domain-containing protein [Planctomycetota bacterium]
MPEQWLALIHIEIESPVRTTVVKPRLPFYYVSLRERHGLPVLPIVLYLKVGLEGIGIDTYTEQFWELQALTFNYLYVGLPGLDAVQYVQGENWLGVALTALMKIPAEQVVWLGAEAMRRVVSCPLSEQKRFLLADCIEAYRNLNAQQQLEYEKLLLGSAFSGVKAMNKTTYEKGQENALEQAVLRSGKKKFGPIPTEIESRIRSIKDPAMLGELIERVHDVQSWEELLAS